MVTKKILGIIAFGFIILIMTGCAEGNKSADSDTPEDAVTAFAQHFGEMVNNNDIVGVRNVYDTNGTINSLNGNLNLDEIEIFPEEGGKYKIKYGAGKNIVINVGLNNAIEVVESQGIVNIGSAAAETVSASVETPTARVETTDAPKVSDEAAIKKFASQFKKNVKADSRWSDGGWNESKYSGTAYIYVRNNNSVPVDASDYYITYKYEYLYEMGADMYSENCKQKGKEIPAKGKAKFTHHYTDDCGPLAVKVHFNLSDKQIYDKYANR